MLLAVLLLVGTSPAAGVAAITDQQLKPVAFTVQNDTLSILSRMAGDPDGDGEITLQDVAVLIRSIIGGWNASVIGVNADVNADGCVDLRDAVLIQRYIVGGWDVELL